jgi:hypothetical protein
MRRIEPSDSRRSCFSSSRSHMTNFPTRRWSIWLINTRDPKNGTGYASKSPGYSCQVFSPKPRRPVPV